MEEVKPNAEMVLKGFQTKDLRRQHAVLFFLTAPMFEDADEMEGAKRQFAKISNMGLNPIIVIARADEIDPSIRSAPMAKCAEVEQQRESAAQRFGIPLSRVHISVPYCAEEERVFDIERQNYKLINAALQAAVEFKSLSAAINQCSGGLDWGVPDGYVQPQPQPSVASSPPTPAPTTMPVALPVSEGVSTSCGSDGGSVSTDSEMATLVQQMRLEKQKLEAKMLQMQQQHTRELAATRQLAALGSQDPSCAALLQSMFGS
jgi:hypothetical protein